MVFRDDSEQGLVHNGHMNLPFDPNYFKKLGLFQKLQQEDKRLGDDPVWQMEKVLLEWVHTRHSHLGKYLNEQFVYDRFKESERARGIHYDAVRIRSGLVMENLVARGWAEWFVQDGKPEKSYGIQITRDGMVMAEVMNDVTEHGKTRFYIRASRLSWVVFSLTVVALCVTIIKPIYDVAHDLRVPATPTPVSVSVEPITTTVTVEPISTANSCTCSDEAATVDTETASAVPQEASHDAPEAIEATNTTASAN